MPDTLRPRGFPPSLLSGSLRFLLILALSAGFAGCTSSHIARTSGADAPAGAVSEVLVTTRPGQWDADTDQDYRASPAAGLLRAELLAELEKRGKIRPGGDTTLEFVVTSFRLRSASLIVWWGSVTDGDRLSGTVIVRRGNTVVKSFEAGGAVDDIGFTAIMRGRVAPAKRAQTFCRMIARNVADKL